MVNIFPISYKSFYSCQISKFLRLMPQIIGISVQNSINLRANPRQHLLFEFNHCKCLVLFSKPVPTFSFVSFYALSFYQVSIIICDLGKATLVAIILIGIGKCQSISIRQVKVTQLPSSNTPPQACLWVCQTLLRHNITDYSQKTAGPLCQGSTTIITQCTVI